MQPLKWMPALQLPGKHSNRSPTLTFFLIRTIRHHHLVTKTAVTDL